MVKGGEADLKTMADLGPQVFDRVLGHLLQMFLSVMFLVSAPNLDPMQCLNRGQVCKKHEIEKVWVGVNSSSLPRGLMSHHGRDI